MIEIKKFREEKNLTRTEFAKKLGVARTTVYRWETGKTAPSDEMLSKIEEVFSKAEEGEEKGEKRKFGGIFSKIGLVASFFSIALAGILLVECFGVLATYREMQLLNEGIALHAYPKMSMATSWTLIVLSFVLIIASSIHIVWFFRKRKDHAFMMKILSQ